MLGRSVRTLPFSAPHNVMLTMLVCATRSFFMHLYTLSYMSMHESCLLVRRPCLNTVKLWKFNPNLYLSLANTTFCLLSCLPFIILVFFMPLSYPFCIFSFHCLYVGFLSLPLHVHTWSENAWS